MAIFKKSQKVYCDRCDNDLFELTTDVQSGDLIRRDHFSPIPPQTLAEMGEIVKCDHCGYEGITLPLMVREG